MGDNYYDRRHIYTDDVLVETYLKYQSQIKAAHELGVSRETVARAVRRSNIPLTGRKNNGDHKGNGGGGSPRKILDEELIEESKTMTRNEIAEKHHMCVCNVDRKLKRLNIKCCRKPVRFRDHVAKIGSGRHHHERAIAYACEYDVSVTMKKVIKRDRGICQICGKPVDAGDYKHGKTGNLYPTIDHIIPMSLGGGHVWDNVQLAHMYCNAKKGCGTGGTEVF